MLINGASIYEQKGNCKDFFKLKKDYVSSQNLIELVISLIFKMRNKLHNFLNV